MGLHIAHSVHSAGDRHAGDMIFVPSSLLYFIKKRILVINTDIGCKRFSFIICYYVYCSLKRFRDVRFFVVNGIKLMGTG